MRFVVWCLLLLPCLCPAQTAGLAAAPAAPNAALASAVGPIIKQPIAYAIGDQWIYHRKDLLENRDAPDLSYQVTEVSKGMAWVNGRDRNTQWWIGFDNQLGRFVERRAYGTFYANARGPITSTSSKEAEAADIQFPIEVGHRYRIIYDAKDNSGEVIGVYELDGSVESYEKLRLASGEFAVFKIVVKGRFRNYSMGTDDILQSTYWWAPAVKREVAVEFKQWDEHGKLYVHKRVELAKYLAGR